MTPSTWVRYIPVLDNLKGLARKIYKDLQGKEVLQQALRPSRGSTVKLTQQSYLGVEPRLLQPINNSVESSFELLHGVAVNNVHRERVPLSADLVQKIISTEITAELFQFKFIAMIPNSSFLA